MMKTNRPDQHEYFMSLALIAAQRASCPRRKVGCVLVDAEKHIVSTGYNGPAPGLPNCTEKPCGGQHHKSGEGLSSCIAIHAEANAINQAGKRLESVTAMYLTAGPCCPSCTETLANAISNGLMPNFKTIFFFDHYPSDTAEIFQNLGIELVCLDRHLSEDGLLFKTAEMLGLRERSKPIHVLCIGGIGHGNVYTKTDLKYLRLYAADMKPDEFNCTSISAYCEGSKASMIANEELYHDYYCQDIVINYKQIRVFRYSKLTDSEFRMLFDQVIKSGVLC